MVLLINLSPFKVFIKKKKKKNTNKWQNNDKSFTEANYSQHRYRYRKSIKCQICRKYNHAADTCNPRNFKPIQRQRQ
jgi:hypothetical protein